MKITATTTFEEIDEAVLAYLTNKKRVNEEAFNRLAIFGVKATDLLRYFNNKIIAEKWGEEFTDKIYYAIEKTYEKYITD